MLAGQQKHISDLIDSTRSAQSWISLILKWISLREVTMLATTNTDCIGVRRSANFRAHRWYCEFTWGLCVHVILWIMSSKSCFVVNTVQQDISDDSIKKWELWNESHQTSLLHLRARGQFFRLPYNVLDPKAQEQLFLVQWHPCPAWSSPVSLNKAPCFIVIDILQNVYRQSQQDPLSSQLWLAVLKTFPTKAM